MAPVGIKHSRRMGFSLTRWSIYFALQTILWCSFSLGRNMSVPETRDRSHHPIISISCIGLCVYHIHLSSFLNLESFFFYLTFLLEYNCFTMVCYFLLHNKVNQLYIHIYPHISSLLRLPPSNPPYPTLLAGHKAPSWSPCAMQLLPTSYLFYIW